MSLPYYCTFLTEYSEDFIDCFQKQSYFRLEIYNFLRVKMRIYAQSIGEHSVILSDLPENMTFFRSLTEENFDALKKLIRSELGE